MSNDAEKNGTETENYQAIRGEIQTLQDQMRLLRSELKRAVEVSIERQEAQPQQAPPSRPQRQRSYIHQAQMPPQSELSQSLNGAMGNPMAGGHSSQKVHQILMGLYREVEILRKIHPLKSLLAAKDLEIRRLESSLNSVPPQSQERGTLENIIRDHYNERSQLRAMASQVEMQVMDQLEKIKRAAADVLPESVPFPDMSEPA